jgi:hypothetical protein
MGLELAVLAAGLVALVWIVRRSPVLAVLVVCLVGGLLQTGAVRPTSALLDQAVKGKQAVATWQERQGARIACRSRAASGAGLEDGVDCR